MLRWLNRKLSLECVKGNAVLMPEGWQTEHGMDFKGEHWGSTKSVNIQLYVWQDLRKNVKQMTKAKCGKEQF